MFICRRKENVPINVGLRELSTLHMCTKRPLTCLKETNKIKYLMTLNLVVFR